ncbi:MAG: head GIN domain-containing protein [Bacteroidota bacterium]
MNRYFLVLVFILSFNLLEAKEVKPFNKVYVFGNLDVELVKSDKPRVEILPDSLVRDNFTIEVKEDSTLEIKLVKGLFDSKTKAGVQVFYTSIHEIKTKGGADVWSKSSMEVENLNLTANTGGTINLSISNDKVSVGVSAGSTISLQGDTDYIKADASGGGVLSAFDLFAEKAEIGADLGGIAKIGVLKELSAKASTNGYVAYKGDPGKIKENATFGGEIVREGDLQWKP